MALVDSGLEATSSHSGNTSLPGLKGRNTRDLLNRNYKLHVAKRASAIGGSQVPLSLASQ